MSERRFPIQCSRITSIPWAMIAPHEAQALRNHRQTLERLGARGGLSPREVLAVIGGRGLPRMYPENAERRLVVAVAQWEAEQPVQPAPSAPLIPQSRAEAVSGNETTNGKSFAVDVLGQPMREVSPGKWENYVPQSRAEEMVAEEREACAKAAERIAMSESRHSPNLADEVAAAIRARAALAPEPTKGEP